MGARSSLQTKWRCARRDPGALRVGLPRWPTPPATCGSHFSAGICGAFTLARAERQVRMDPATRFYNRDDKVN